MSDFKARLTAFASAPMDPQVLWGLPSTFPALPDAVARTNTAFLVRVALEARDVLDRGDSQLKTFHFTSDDVNRIYHGFQICLKLLQAGELHEEAQSRITLLPAALRNIVTYYQDKEVALQTALDSARNELPCLRQTFENMVQRRDYAGLLKQYEHFGSLLDLVDTPDSSASNVPGLNERRRDRRTLEAFKAEVDNAAQGDLGRIWLGRTTKERLLEDTITICHANIQRNHPIQQTIQWMANVIDDVLCGHDPLPRNVVRLPSKGIGT